MTKSKHGSSKNAAKAAKGGAAPALSNIPVRREELVVGEGEEGRLDKWLSDRLPDLSRSYLQKLLKDGAVLTAEGEAVPGRHKISRGESFVVLVPETREPLPQAEDIPLDVVYEDDSLLVVNKPSGLATHPSAGHDSGTLVNALLGHCGDSLSGINGVRRPGIVHRLDLGTSGLLLVAKNDEAHRPLGEALARREIERTYLALVQGEVNEPDGAIEGFLGRDPHDRLRRAVVRESAPDARRARTLWAIERKFHGATLLRVKLETGRTHQVRVHLASMGHPVVGDELYGYQIGAVLTKLATTSVVPARLALVRLKRPYLHAWRLAFTHPVKGERLSLEAALPKELQTILDALEQWAR